MRQRELEDKVAARQGHIAPELLFQYENLFHVLKVTIRPVSHRQWTSGDTPAQTPVRQACHIAGACHVYATGDRDICERHFGVPVCSFDQEIPADQLPTTEQVLAYIEVVREHVADWLGDMSNETLLGPRPGPGWSQRGWTMCATPRCTWAISAPSSARGGSNSACSSRVLWRPGSGQTYRRIPCRKARCEISFVVCTRRSSG